MTISNISTARSPVPWFGGKQRLADRIADLLAPHEVYVEAFGGGASVLLSKPPSRLEVYNDLDDGLVNFFRCLRDRGPELQRLLRWTPYSRSEFVECRATWHEQTDELERARRWYVKTSQSFAAHTHKTTGWGAERLGRLHLGRAASTANRVDHMLRFAERLRRVQIDNVHWRDCLATYDSPVAAFYLDPPYVHETRSIDASRGRGYAHEMSLDDHRELVAAVLALQAPSVIVSGYDHDSYRPLDEAGFSRVEFDVHCASSNRSGRGGSSSRRVEVLWFRGASQEALF